MALDAQVAAIWRIESARVVGALARITGDLDVAEDLAQDALVAALEQWPRTGVPQAPGAWLTTVGRRRWVDGVRRDVVHRRSVGELGRSTPDAHDPTAEVEIVTTVEDDVLRLVFAACHPVLAPEARVALTLRTVGGLTTEEIARAFLVPVPTMAARITRAKKALGAAGVPFEVPVGDELAPRVGSVLAVVYSIFTEGYAATSGPAWTRPVLCQEAMRLGRLVAALVPSAGEAHALVALMELQASRLRARHAADGTPVLLEDQDRGRWDRTLIGHALGALARAEALGGRGPYLLQAAIAAVHARAGRAADTDWPRIAALYGELVEVTGSPVVELNRAVAVGRADGPAAGLRVLDDLEAEDVPALRDYHLVPAVRGDLLERLGRPAEAAAAFTLAAQRCGNDAERAVLLRRAGEQDQPR